MNWRQQEHVWSLEKRFWGSFASFIKKVSGSWLFFFDKASSKHRQARNLLVTKQWTLTKMLCKLTRNYYNPSYVFTNHFQCDPTMVHSAPARPSHLCLTRQHGSLRSRDRDAGHTGWSSRLPQKSTPCPLRYFHLFLIQWPFFSKSFGSAYSPYGYGGANPCTAWAQSQKCFPPLFLWLMESQMSQHSWVTRVENLQENCWGFFYNSRSNLQLSQAFRSWC